MREAHDIVRKHNRWWCDTEDVDANICEDETRCEYQCYCNKDRFEVRLILNVNTSQEGNPTKWNWADLLDLDGDDIQTVEVGML